MTNPFITSTRVRAALRGLDLHPTRGMGQNFLIDPAVLEQIVAAGEIRREDTVVEVGPGLGVLTWELVQRVDRMIAVELDRRLAARLEQEFNGEPRLHIVQGDILDLPPEQILGSQSAVGSRQSAVDTGGRRQKAESSQEQSAGGSRQLAVDTEGSQEQSAVGSRQSAVDTEGRRQKAGDETRDARRETRDSELGNINSKLKTQNSKLNSAIQNHYKVIANLPYAITSPVLRHFLEARWQPEVMVVLVQWEVAQRIAARQGDLSMLAHAIQFYAEPEVIAQVPATSFVPAPAVSSAILRLRVRAHPPVDVDDVKAFFRVIKASFLQPRKKLSNAFPGGLAAMGQRIERTAAVAVLQDAGISPERRAETVSLEEWARVYKRLKDEG